MYTWESLKKVTVPLAPDKIIKGYLVPAAWEQKLVCRRCSGEGCTACNGLGYYTKEKNMPLQIQDEGQLVNGTWYKYLGHGDERPDCAGFGDVVVQIHIIGMQAPQTLDPALGNSDLYMPGNTPNMPTEIGDVFHSIFGVSMGPPPVMAKLKLKPQELKEGCKKQITIVCSQHCKWCVNESIGVYNTTSACKHCNGTGLIQGGKSVAVQVPPQSKQNQRIILRQQGNVQMIQGIYKKGDIIVTLKKKRLFF